MKSVGVGVQIGLTTWRQNLPMALLTKLLYFLTLSEFERKENSRMFRLSCKIFPTGTIQLDERVFEGVADQVGVVLHVQLVEKPGSIGADRFHT